MSDAAPNTEEKELAVRKTITLPPELEPELRRRATEEHRSLSAHVAWLIEQDVRRHRAEAVPA